MPNRKTRFDDINTTKAAKERIEMLERGELVGDPQFILVDATDPFQHSSTACLTKELEWERMVLEKQRDEDRKALLDREKEANPSITDIAVLLGLSKDDIIDRQRARIEELEDKLWRGGPKSKLLVTLGMDW